MKKKTFTPMRLLCLFFLLLWGLSGGALAREFVHPGGLHTLADLERMKRMVARGEQPWAEGWKALCQDPLAQHTFRARPMANMGDSRQKASVDAHAAYLNAIRWYISGEEKYARCAIAVCNAWAETVDQVPRARQDQGLLGIPISEFAMAAELLRVCPLWEADDFERFKEMMLTYLYPVSRDFLLYHDGTRVDYCWTNWDACNMVALVAIGVLCDREDIYDQGVAYYKHGPGNGSIFNAVPFLHRMADGSRLGQWQESGRDQAHAQLGVGFLSNVCQIAWNQGDDLFSYADNRLLAGAEYVARHNQMRPVPFTYYNNSQEMHNRWPATNAQGVLGERPVWELIYNHYEVRMGIPAPYCRRMAELLRPEHGSKDHFGYGTLTFTLTPSAFPPLPVPAVPQGLKAEASIGKVFLSWEPSEDFAAYGYVIQRSEVGKNAFRDLAVYSERVMNYYTDTDVEPGKAYDYRVAAVNHTGQSPFSAPVSAAPWPAGVLPAGWALAEIGSASGCTAGYARVGEGSFVLETSAAAEGGTQGRQPFAYREVEGNFSLVCRLHGRGGKVAEAGLLVQAGSSADAPMVSLTLGHVGGRFARMGSRTAAGAPVQYAVGNAYTWLPAWFRLVRVGNVFYAYESPDGIDWHYIHSVEIPLPPQVCVGLTGLFPALEQGGRAEFDHVSVESL